MFTYRIELKLPEAYAPILGGTKWGVPAISFAGAPVAVPPVFKGEPPTKFKPSSVVPKISSIPSVSFIFTKGSVVRATKFEDPLIPPTVLFEALLLDAPAIAIPEISGLLVAVLP